MSRSDWEKARDQFPGWGRIALELGCAILALWIVLEILVPELPAIWKLFFGG